jgi:hypothetical protein
VKTNVLFFTRGAKDKDGTKAVWFYDMRSNAPSFATSAVAGRRARVTCGLLVDGTRREDLVGARFGHPDRLRRVPC